MRYTLNINNRLQVWERPQVMSIINMTPDSFYATCGKLSAQALAEHIEQAIAEGADILDIGGVSTRPGAEMISAEEEWQRIEPALSIARQINKDIVLSVDTYRAEVARKAVEKYQVGIVNDISGGLLDNQMFQTVAELGVPYVLTHFRGTPQTMAELTQYDDLLADIMHFFARRLSELERLGAKDVIIDPGFGFAKTMEQNYELLANLEFFSELNKPILVGLSHKSMLTKLLRIDKTEALEATTAANMLALTKGAALLRVHETRAAAETVKIFEQTKKLELELKRYVF